jgi:TPP-dependent pyruvate/acetoin dehydrogenase alpha subunit
MKNQLQKLYKKMLLIRVFEEKIIDEYPNSEMRCPVHLSIGQEASAVGICEELSKKDSIFSTHRSHAHYIAKNGDLDKMTLEIYGKEGGCCAGRGGSMHLFDNDAGILASIPIVSSNIPLAVGSALNEKINNTKNITVAFFGDGSVEEGVFHESANFASINDLPVLFVCENNYFSVYTKLSDRQPNRKINELAKSHGIKSYEIDGNDVIKINHLVKKIIKEMKAKSFPVFITLNTYRWLEHCGTNYDNHLGYRSLNEFKKWKKRDPLKILENKLLKNKILSKLQIKLLKEKLIIQVDKHFENAKKAPFPKDMNLESKVYAK